VTQQNVIVLQQLVSTKNFIILTGYLIGDRK